MAFSFACVAEPARGGDEHPDQIENRALDQALPVSERAEAVRALVEKKDFDIVPKLMKDPILRRPLTAYDEVHRSDVVDFCRSALDLILAQAGEGKSVARLCELFKTQESPSLSYLARGKLAEIGGEEAVSRLVALAEDKSASYITRVDAIMALRGIGSVSAVPALAKIANDSNESNNLREGAKAAAAHIEQSKAPDVPTEGAPGNLGSPKSKPTGVLMESYSSMPKNEPATVKPNPGTGPAQRASATQSANGRSGWAMASFMGPAIGLALAALAVVILVAWLLLRRRGKGTEKAPV